MKDLKEVFSKNLALAVNDSDLNYSDLAATLGISKATMSMYKHGKGYRRSKRFPRYATRSESRLIFYSEREIIEYHIKSRSTNERRSAFRLNFDGLTRFTKRVSPYFYNLIISLKIFTAVSA